MTTCFLIISLPSCKISAQNSSNFPAVVGVTPAWVAKSTSLPTPHQISTQQPNPFNTSQQQRLISGSYYIANHSRAWSKSSGKFSRLFLRKFSPLGCATCHLFPSFISFGSSLKGSDPRLISLPHFNSHRLMHLRIIFASWIDFTASISLTSFTDFLSTSGHLSMHSFVLVQYPHPLLLFILLHTSSRLCQCDLSLSSLECSTLCRLGTGGSMGFNTFVLCTHPTSPTRHN
jgi:hypothetical protein